MTNGRKNEEISVNRELAGLERAIPNRGTHMRPEPAKTWAGVFFVIALLCAVQAYADDVKKEPPVLTTARLEYERAFNAATKPIMTKYIERLDKMKRDLGGKGDAVGAFAVQQEIDAVTAALSEKPKPPSDDAASSIAGIWIVKYSNGVIRQYDFSQDGNVEKTEAGTVVTGTYKKEKAGFLIDVDSGNRLEFWRHQNATTWNVHHYSPAINYPKGRPAVTGIATKQ